MSLADDVQQFEATPKHNPCKTGVWLAGLDPRDSDAFADFLKRGGTTADLHKIAIKNGCDAAETQFRRHCNRTCSCFRILEIVE